MLRQYHERLDGSGYSGSLKMDEINPESRILAATNVVEAMTSHHPYRLALVIDTTLAEIESSKGV